MKNRLFDREIPGSNIHHPYRSGSRIPGTDSLACRGQRDQEHLYETAFAPTQRQGGAIPPIRKVGILPAFDLHG